MGRRLPDYDPDTDGEYGTSKRRIQLFKRVYQNYYHWCSLRQTGSVDDVLAVDGEEIYLGDLMTGIETLPLRQRQAFELICLQGYTESAATAILLPNSKWSTPVQQYSDDGLKKMVLAYDAKQNGTWDPAVARRKRRRKPCEDTPTGQESVATPESGYSISSEEVFSATDTEDDDADTAGLKSAETDTDTDDV
jgi:hypothetical protein